MKIELRYRIVTVTLYAIVFVLIGAFNIHVVDTHGEYKSVLHTADVTALSLDLDDYLYPSYYNSAPYFALLYINCIFVNELYMDKHYEWIHLIFDSIFIPLHICMRVHLFDVPSILMMITMHSMLYFDVYMHKSSQTHLSRLRVLYNILHEVVFWVVYFIHHIYHLGRTPVDNLVSCILFFVVFGNDARLLFTTYTNTMDDKLILCITRCLVCLSVTMEMDW